MDDRTPSRPDTSPAPSKGLFSRGSRRLFSRGGDRESSRRDSKTRSFHTNAAAMGESSHWMVNESHTIRNPKAHSSRGGGGYDQDRAYQGRNTGWAAAQEEEEEEEEGEEDDWYRQYGETLATEKEDGDDLYAPPPEEETYTSSRNTRDYYEREEDSYEREDDDWYRQYDGQKEREDEYMPDEEEEEEEEAYIEKLVGHRRNEQGGLEFKVHWSDTSDDEDEWFERSAVATEYPALLHKYEKKHGLGKRKKKGKSKGRSRKSEVGKMHQQEQQLYAQRHQDAEAEMAKQKNKERRRWQKAKRREKKEKQALKQRQILAQRKEGQERFRKKVELRARSRAAELLVEARTVKRQAMENQRRLKSRELRKWNEDEEKEQKILANAFIRARKYAQAKSAQSNQEQHEEAPPAYEAVATSEPNNAKWMAEKADLQLERDAARNQVETLRNRMRQMQLDQKLQIEKLTKDPPASSSTAQESGFYATPAKALAPAPAPAPAPVRSDGPPSDALQAKWQAEKEDLETARDAARRQVATLRSKMHQLQKQLQQQQSSSSEATTAAMAPSAAIVGPPMDDAPPAAATAATTEQLAEATRAADQKVTELNAQVEAKAKQVSELQAELAAVQSKHEDLRVLSTESAKAAMAHASQVEHLQAELGTAQKRLQEERDSGLKMAGAKGKAAAQEVARVKAALGAVEGQLSEKEQVLSATQAELQSAQASAQSLSQALEEQRQGAEALRESSQRELSELGAQLQTTKAELGAMSTKWAEARDLGAEKGARLTLLEQEAAETHEELQKSELNLARSKESVAHLQAKKAELEEELRRLQEAHDTKVLQMETAFAAECSEKDNRIGELEEQVQDGDKLLAQIRLEISAREAEAAAKAKEYGEIQKRADKLEREQEAREHAVAVMRRKTAQLEEERREMHAVMQTLRGNVRVVCRVRPLLGKEKDVAETAGIPEAGPLKFPARKPWEGNRDPIVLSPWNAEGTVSKRDEKHFLFDRVFQIGTDQVKVFNEIQKLVQSAIDGFNVCIFAYGQTGSGKTYTMSGAREGEHMGVIPRTVDRIFTCLEELQVMGWTVQVKACMLEIYNESIRDLLRHGPHDPNIKYDIKHTADGQTSINQLTVDEISTAADIYPLLKRADKNRATGKTNMNEHSSRSHLVFQLQLSGHNPSTGSTRRGMLNLIDLAGSERLDRTGATGDRLKEAQAINKSLSCLGDVFASISNKSSHIPYRNSKLTYLLQYCLAPPSKTLMFVNVSPVVESTSETLCSLRFAAKVNNCDMSLGGGEKKKKKPKAPSGDSNSKKESAKEKTEGDDKEKEKEKKTTKKSEGGGIKKGGGKKLKKGGGTKNSLDR